MSPPLLYLWFALLKRRGLRSLRGLRRPATLIGVAAVAALLGALLYYRRHYDFLGHLGWASAIGGMLIMLCGSVFQGFLRRGLAFDPPDLEFLFTGPFTQRQIVLYRLLPDYLFALVQGLFFFVFFEPYLRHPAIVTVCFVFFQIGCFHAAAAAAIFAGSLDRTVHYRLRWLLLGLYFMLAVIYLRTAFDIRLIPAFASSPWFQLLFYPAVNLSRLASSHGLREWGLRLISADHAAARAFSREALCVAVFAGGAWASLFLLFRIKADVFESSLETTGRVAEKRLRLRQGRRAGWAEGPRAGSVRLPQLPIFRGAGAILWKNLLIARRSKRELAVGLAFTLIYTLPLVALLRWHDGFVGEMGSSSSFDADFDHGMAGMMACLAFLLQWAFPFDFRRDGRHLVGFRTLPFSSFALALVEVAVPTLCCLVFQLLGVAALMIYARFNWLDLVLVVLAYPAVALALNGVWNLHYLLSASKRAAGRHQSPSAVGTLMVVALSFLVFFPAGWAAQRVSNLVHHNDPLMLTVSFASWLVVQYAVDFLLLLLLVRLLDQFEVSRDV